MAAEFTVVIALHNKAPFIRGTLQSVLGQDRSPQEILLVDDGSTDGSLDAIADLIGGNVRIVAQANSGPGPARNRGVAEARSEWVALLDADDLWLPDHLSTMAALVEAFPDAGAASTGFARVPANDRAVPGGVPKAPTAPYALDYFIENMSREAMWTSSVAVRRDAYQQVGGFGAYWPGEDMELWARLALDFPIAATRKVTALYTVATGGLMDQSASAPRFGVGAEPEFLVLDAALANPAYAAKHAGVAAYRDHLLAQRVRQSLYSGDSPRARAFLRLVSASRRSRLLPDRLLSLLPHWALQPAMRAYRRAKASGG
jgi:glycosyltransferase involved in cell wall biosynthesis